MNPATFQGWIVFANGEAHALYTGEDGLVYFCGNVLYDRTVPMLPLVPGFDVRFCPDCIQAARYRAERALAASVR